MSSNNILLPKDFDKEVSDLFRRGKMSAAAAAAVATSSSTSERERTRAPTPMWGIEGKAKSHSDGVAVSASTSSDDVGRSKGKGGDLQIDAELQSRALPWLSALKASATERGLSSVAGTLSHPNNGRLLLHFTVPPFWVTSSSSSSALSAPSPLKTANKTCAQEVYNKFATACSLAYSRRWGQRAALSASLSLPTADVAASGSSKRRKGEGSFDVQASRRVSEWLTVGAKVSVPSIKTAVASAGRSLGGPLKGAKMILDARATESEEKLSPMSDAASFEVTARATLPFGCGIDECRIVLGREAFFRGDGGNRGGGGGSASASPVSGATVAAGVSSMEKWRRTYAIVVDGAIADARLAQGSKGRGAQLTMGGYVSLRCSLRERVSSSFQRNKEREERRRGRRANNDDETDKDRRTDEANDPSSSSPLSQPPLLGGVGAWLRDQFDGRRVALGAKLILGTEKPSSRGEGNDPAKPLTARFIFAAETRCLFVRQNTIRIRAEAASTTAATHHSTGAPPVAVVVGYTHKQKHSAFHLTLDHRGRVGVFATFSD